MADKEKPSLEGVILKIEFSEDGLNEYSSAIAIKTAELLSKHTKPEQSTTYLSSDAVCKTLDISRTTLWHLDKKGVTKPIWLRNVKRYRVSDIEAIGQNGRKVCEA